MTLHIIIIVLCLWIDIYLCVYRNELESQLGVVEREMYQLQQQMTTYASANPQPMMEQHHHQQHQPSYHG